MKKTMKTKTAALRRTAAVAAGTLVAASSLLAPKSVLAENTGSQELLEQRLMIMEEQMKALQNELARVREEAAKPTEKVMELEEWVANVKTIEPSRKKNLIFFRGGFARNDTDRTGDILTDANADNSGAGTNILGAGLNTTDFTGNSPNGDNEGYYVGAGIEHSLTEDLWGLWDGTELMGEIMFEYKEFDDVDLRRAPLATAANDSVSAAAIGAGGPVCSGSAAADGILGGSAVTGTGAGPYGDCSNSVHVTQFTLTASPKIKFNQGGSFRPWIIPIGFAFHVVSPPSDGVTYTAPGAMFGAGGEYNLWQNINLGLDARYHLTNNSIDDVKIDGFTAGAYLGFGF